MSADLGERLQSVRKRRGLSQPWPTAGSGALKSISQMQIEAKRRSQTPSGTS